MKSTFGRTLTMTLLILLVTLLLLGFSFLYLAQQYLRTEATAGLRTDAQAISELAGAYYARTGLNSQNFRLNVALVARASGVDAVICDANGTVLFCADAPLGCDHQGMVLNSKYMERILAADYSTDVGIIRGLYHDSRYVVSTPIRERSGQKVGAVITSTPTAKTVAVMARFREIYLITATLAMAVAAVGIVILFRRQTDPLREMAKAASAFGHGEMDARVEVDADDPEEIQELALAFNNMAVSLQKDQVRQQEFVAGVSHELKTPMTTIGGYVDGMLDGTIPPEKYRQYMHLVSDETKRLSRLVRSMLEISRLQDGERIPEEEKSLFDVSECVGQVLITFDQAIEQKKLNVEAFLPDFPVYTRASADAITQVVYNLVDNAVKFSHGTLGVKVQEGGKKIFVSVYNDGETIPPEELPLVFDRFHKLDKSRGINQNGWGLGLYIVKTIVLRHGEDISVTSRDGITSFTFTLPRGN